MKKSACYELSRCLPFRNIAEYSHQVAAILKTKMAAKNWTYQLASIKISVQDDLNYLCANFHNFIRKCTLHLIGGLKETKMFLPHPRVKVSIVGSLRDQKVACSASDRQGSNFESCVWRTVSSQSSHHPQEVLLAQFSLYVHKGGLKPDSFHLLHLIY